MNKEFFIGIDISKATLDSAVCRADSPDQFIQEQFANTVPGFKKLFGWLKKQGAQTTNSFLGMEHTGHFTLALCCFLQQVELSYTMISPLELKRSMGLARGKNDRVDAMRIAQFTCLHQRLLKAVHLPSDSLLRLKNLMAFRDRLVKTRTSLKNAVGGLRETSHLIDNTLIIRLSQKQIKLVEQQVAQTEKEMQATIKQDQQLSDHFGLAKSVIGIGLVAAAAFLIHTQNFTVFDSGRQFACYAGVAPFEHSSGSSVRGKTSTSNLANKKTYATEMSVGVVSTFRVNPPDYWT